MDITRADRTPQRGVPTIGSPENLDTRDRAHHPARMNFLNRYADTVYCFMRLIVGLLLACHGLQLVFGMFGGMSGSDKAIMQVGGWIQLVGGFMVAVGLLTRLSAFICSGTMAVAYFMFHVGNAATPMAKFFPISSAGPAFSNRGELAVMYSWIFLFIFFYGSGRLAIDALICKNKGAAAPPTA
jgi:putative oxidoreductase